MDLSLYAILLASIVNPSWSEVLDYCDCKELELVPGYNLGGEGFDITTMTRKTSNVVDMKKVITPDGKCHAYQNDQLAGKPKQKVPAAVTSWKVRHECSSQMTYQSYNSALKYSQSSSHQTTSAWSIGLSAAATGPIPGHPGTSGSVDGSVSAAGSHSSLASFTRTNAKSKQSMFSEHSIQCIQYEYSLADSNLPLDNNFVATLKALPDEYEGNENAYKQFIGSFGTHYFRKVTLGGQLKAVTIIESCDLTSYGVSLDEVSQCLSVEAAVNVGAEVTGSGIGGSGGVSGTTASCQDKMRASGSESSFSSVFSRQEYDIIGGDTRRMADVFFSSGGSNKYKRWIAGLRKKPEVIRFEVAPIFSALKYAACRDVPNLGKKTSALLKATEVYLYERRMLAESSLCAGACTFQCPPGSTQDDQCHCRCSASENTDANCCPKKMGMGKLTIRNIQAYNLDDADSFNQADAYVKTVQISPGMRTSVIDGNDDPRWGDVWDFGDQQPGREFILELLDEDDGGAGGPDDLLVSCRVTLKGNSKETKNCHGVDGARLQFDVDFKCFSGFSGDMCDINPFTSKTEIEKCPTNSASKFQPTNNPFSDPICTKDTASQCEAPARTTCDEEEEVQHQCASNADSKHCQDVMVMLIMGLLLAMVP